MGDTGAIHDGSNAFGTRSTWIPFLGSEIWFPCWQAMPRPGHRLAQARRCPQDLAMAASCGPLIGKGSLKCSEGKQGRNPTRSGPKGANRVTGSAPSFLSNPTGLGNQPGWKVTKPNHRKRFRHNSSETYSIDPKGFNTNPKGGNRLWRTR